MENAFDVVQVGYGPVGQVLAALLGAMGHRVQVVERHTSLYTVSRAGTFDHEVMRVLQSAGVAAELEDKVARNFSMSLYDAKREPLAELAIPRDSVSGWHSAYTMYQPDLEVALDRRVRSLAGVEVQTGLEVLDIRQSGDGVEIDSQDRQSGEVTTSRGRYLIGADGANSVVRSKVGIGQEDLGYSGPWLVCDFEHHDPGARLGFRAGFVMDPARPLLIGRWLGRRHSRMEFMVLPGEDPTTFDETTCWSLAGEWGVTPATSSLVRHAVYEFGSQLATTWRQGRVLLAGDAAHVMPPFLGQGFCSGVRDAANLAWKLDLVLRGVASDDLLDTYTSERRGHVEAVTRISMGLGDIVSMTDPEQAAGRDEFIRAVGAPPPQEFPGLSGGVFHGAGEDSPEPRVGQLSLQAEVAVDGRAGLLDDVVGGGWRLLSRVPVDLNALSPAQQNVLQATGAKVVLISPADADGYCRDTNLDYEAWFDKLEAEAVLVRPDFYTYASIGDVSNIGAVLDDLGRALCLM